MSSKYPPYPPYEPTPAPPSVADAIDAGHSLSVQHKSVFRPSVYPVPKPARPKTPKVTDVKMSRRAMRAHACCLRRHGAVLTDRLERLAKPRRRNIIYLWREHAELLPPETIERFRNMLSADEPFKPDQAYEYFITCRKAKKRNAAHCSLVKKDTHAVVTDKRFLWARNATVAFARGIQQRLSRPGRYTLADGMLRLSNVILDETCGYMKMRTPSRRCTNSKAKFMMEMSDKIAVWIDEILSESDDRMLMMDFDEDDEVERSILDESRPPVSVVPSTMTVLAAPDAADTAAGSGSPSPVAPVAVPGAASPPPQPATTGDTNPPPPQPATTGDTNPPPPQPATTGDTNPPPPPAPANILFPGRWSAGGGDDFADDFLNMMGEEIGHSTSAKIGSNNASLETVLKMQVTDRPESTAPT
ncbi:formin-A-like [Cydia fagiglandana]|uniref:formin-A-like n=1 Tax=Cydia fagiglandana TaxID=1458189 RepID=UPI002FEE5AB1